MTLLLSAQSRDFEIDTTVGEWVDYLSTGFIEHSTEESYSGSASLKATIDVGAFGIAVVAPIPQVENVSTGDVLNLLSHHLPPTGSDLGDVFLYAMLGTIPDGVLGVELVATAAETGAIWNTLSGSYVIPDGITCASIGITVNIESAVVGTEVRYFDAIMLEIPIAATAAARPFRQRQRATMSARQHQNPLR